MKKKMTHYEIGYRRPPQHSKWKVGQSGNPRGRRPGSKNGKTILRSVLNEKVSIKKDGKRIRVTTLEFLILKMKEFALKGDVKAFMTLFKLGLEDSEGESDKPNVVEIELIEANGKNLKKLFRAENDDDQDEDK
jgi:hypothetical protein